MLVEIIDRYIVIDNMHMLGIIQQKYVILSFIWYINGKSYMIFLINFSNLNICMENVAFRAWVLRQYSSFERGNNHEVYAR